MTLLITSDFITCYQSGSVLSAAEEKQHSKAKDYYYNIYGWQYNILFAMVMIDTCCWHTCVFQLSYIVTYG